MEAIAMIFIISAACVFGFGMLSLLFLLCALIFDDFAFGDFCEKAAMVGAFIVVIIGIICVVSGLVLLISGCISFQPLEVSE